ncbi:hypothetical protein ACOK4R_35505 (plasmid) [Pseudomonas fluorescens]|uniref:hypothetical protein n=1 Tax=Pseudomonas TaxID=286 RepID=UPI001F145545|nr:hypothetical protein [Pseudomonas viridiflava]
MTSTFQYAIQCDRLQQRTADGPQIWATLMHNAQRVPLEEFEDACDLSGLLEEGESLDDFTCSDPGTGAYRVEVGSECAYFIQTSGFEFFFTPDGVVPSFIEQYPPDWDEYRSSALARLLLPANHPLLQGSWGLEGDEGLNDEGLQVIRSESGSVRYQIHQGDRAVAGIRVDADEVSEMYTCRDKRREGLATTLMDAVRRLHGPLPFSSLSDEGKAFKAGYHRAKRLRQEVDTDFDM